jgi:hypothetical protein
LDVYHHFEICHNNPISTMERVLGETGGFINCCEHTIDTTFTRFVNSERADVWRFFHNFPEPIKNHGDLFLVCNPVALVWTRNNFDNESNVIPL